MTTGQEKNNRKTENSRERKTPNKQQPLANIRRHSKLPKTNAAVMPIHPLPLQTLSRVPTQLVEQTRERVQTVQIPIPRKNFNFLHHVIHLLRNIVEKLVISNSPQHPNSRVSNKPKPPSEFLPLNSTKQHCRWENKL